MREVSIPISGQDFLSSSVDQIVVIEQDDYAHEPTDLTNASSHIPLITEGDLVVSSSTIDVPTKRGNAAESRPARGSETISGSLSLNASVSGSFPLLAAMYTQATQLSWNILGGTGQVLPPEVEVVSNGDLTSTAPMAIADGLQFTDNPVQLNVALVPENINVVSAASIASDGTVTINDDLTNDSADISGNITFTITLSSAALASSSTPGTVTFDYTVTTGGTKSTNLVVSFADGELADTKTITLNDLETVDSVTVAGFNAGTITITAPNPNTIALASGVTSASVEVWGTDHADVQIYEEVTFTAANLHTSQTTDKYFKTVSHSFAAETNSLFTGDENTDRVLVQGWSDGNVDITARDSAVAVTARPNDRLFRRFWTIEYSKGGKPNVYYGLIVNEMSYSIARDGTRVDALSFMGRRGEPNTNLSGTTVTIDPTTGRPSYPQPTDISGQSFADSKVFVGWECRVYVDGTEIGNILPLTTGSFTFTQGMEDANIVSGDRFNTGKPIRNSKRMLVGSFTLRDALQQRFFYLYRNNVPLRNVKIRWSYNAEGEFPYIEDWDFPEMYITSAPDPATSGQSAVDNTLNVRSADESAGDEPLDFSITAHLPQYTAPRTYN